MTLEEINALKLDDVFEFILKLVTKNEYILGTDPDKTKYENLIMANKPYLSELEERFAKYKQGLLDEENERLRREALINRAKSLDNFAETVRFIHNVPNAKKWFKSLLDNPDHAATEILMVELETAHVEIKEEADLDSLVTSEIEIGSKIQGLCKTIIDLITGHNHKADLSKEEIIEFITTFSNIKDLLANGMPATAYKLINKVEGYDELKKKILFIYKKANEQWLSN